MKQPILLILFAICTIAAHGQENLIFSAREWDFGEIHETGGRVSHRFTARNEGERPVVILDVVTSCGCTIPEFSRKPIKPGDEATITVTFDPANRPGVFDKELQVYSSERRKIATLSIHGLVIPRPKSIEERYPIDAGGGLRLSATFCALTYIYTGVRKSATIGYVSTSDAPIRLALHPTEQSGALEIDAPATIPAGASGELNFSYENPAEAPRYGTLNDALEIWIDGRRSEIPLAVHGLAVDNPATTRKAGAPHYEISENIIKFGAIKRTGGVQRRSFTLSNRGGTLIIRAVESKGAFRCDLTAGRRIGDGESVHVEIALDPAKAEFGPYSGHIFLFTNDPGRPMRRVRVTAIVEE